jgi:hypothetical protein
MDTVGPAGGGVKGGEIGDFGDFGDLGLVNEPLAAGSGNLAMLFSNSDWAAGGDSNAPADQPSRELIAFRLTGVTGECSILVTSPVDSGIDMVSVA